MRQWKDGVLARKLEQQDNDDGQSDVSMIMVTVTILSRTDSIHKLHKHLVDVMALT